MTIPLIPDPSIIRRLGSYGDTILIQILDPNDTIVDLTSATNVQIKIQHESIVTDSVVKTAAIQGTASNGTIFYVITTTDLLNVGRYKISSIVSYAISASYPEGKNIISYSTSPAWVVNNV